MRLKGRKYTPPKPPAVKNQFLISSRMGLDQTGIDGLIQSLNFTVTQDNGKPKKIQLFTIKSGKPQ